MARLSVKGLWLGWKDGFSWHVTDYIVFTGLNGQNWVWSIWHEPVISSSTAAQQCVWQQQLSELYNVTQCSGWSLALPAAAAANVVLISNGSRAAAAPYISDMT
jgi:hypothetical protein